MGAYPNLALRGPPRLPPSSLRPAFCDWGPPEVTGKGQKLLPSHRLTWKCTNTCRKTTFLVEMKFVHFHVGWWEGNGIRQEIPLKRIAGFHFWSQHSTSQRLPSAHELDPTPQREKHSVRAAATARQLGTVAVARRRHTRRTILNLLT